MPVFTSRFSPNRVASANLQQIRSRSTEANARVERSAIEREQQSPEQTRRSTDTQPVARSAEALLARTQSGQQIADQLQSQQDTLQFQDTRTSDTASRSQADSRSAVSGNTGSNNQTPLQAPPGVGSTRTRADRDIERPGRLERTPSNPIQQRVLEGLARLRAVTRGVLPQTDNSNRSDRANDVRANDPGSSQAATNLSVQAPGSLQSASVIQAPVAAATGDQPTAEEISRANTTDEIRANLQQDSNEVARGLTRDATRQLQQTTQQTAQNAESQAENQRTQTQTEGRTQIRELKVEERQLSRDLQQTQQTIRQERLRLQRAESSASRSTTASAAAIGTNINILAG
ncbi:MAG: hypothetical protein O3B73_14595 [bacterium]|nr:hypothetical protein [bacterium]